MIYLLFGLLTSGYPVYLDFKRGLLREYDFGDWFKVVLVTATWPFIVGAVYVRTLQAMDDQEQDLDSDDIQDPSGS
jgi:hypothetical protein